MRRAGMELSPSSWKEDALRLYDTCSQFKVGSWFPRQCCRDSGAGLGSSQELEGKQFQAPSSASEGRPPLVSWGMPGCLSDPSPHFWGVLPLPLCSSSAPPHCLFLTSASGEGLGDSSVLELVTDTVGFHNVGTVLVLREGHPETLHHFPFKSVRMLLLRYLGRCWGHRPVLSEA